MPETLSASRLNDFLGCAHQAALWLAGEKPPEKTDATVDLLRKAGFEHEHKVLARLEQRYGAATEIPSEGSLEARREATLDAIKANAPLISQAALVHGRWLGYPDFLIRREDGRYEPEDAKLARKPKAEHILQLGIYAELLADLGLSPVAGGAIHPAGGPPVPFSLKQTRFALRRMMRRFEKFAEAPPKTRPIPCSACSQCDYQPKCEDEWRAADSTIFVAGVSGTQMLKLEQGGIETLEQLATFDPASGIEGMGSETLAKLVAQARLQLQARKTGKPDIELLPRVPGRGFRLLPPPDAGDLFLDLEGDPLYEEGLEYLFGVWGPLGEGGAPEFKPHWAHSHGQEKAAFETVMRLFVAHIAQHPGAHIYHYGHYEITALKRLAMRYASMEAELDQMLRDRRFVDLLRVVRQSIRTSTESYSLKELELFYRGKREDAITTAADGIVEYERWRVTNDDEILVSLARYNEADCRSTAELRGWLEKKRPADAPYQPPVIEDTDKQAERSAEREALEARKQDVARRVRASTVGDERLREVVAELLWFHQRAQKPGWWAVFERQSWSDDELVEDPESLGGLTRDTTVTPAKVKRSFDTTFRFPPQDTKLRMGSKPKIAATGRSAGTIVDLDPEGGRIVLRRGEKAEALPAQFGLISAPIDQQNLPDAVLAFAERYASGQLQNDSALMDFLLRQPPRLKAGGSGTPPQPEGESASAAAVQAALALDGSYLFIQGPPGTGKTYTAAEIACLLVEKGCRVGISSNSHKAINNLLNEIEVRAAATGQSFVGAKRGSKDDPETHFDSKHITTVMKSEDIGKKYSLVGGTAFHFSRPDQQGQFDYLIVDEAGQVALGNLVAMAGAARNLILVGDQMQLPQPVQGVHPGETGLSSLEYLLEDKATVPVDRGVFLNETQRLHPDLCSFISDAMYDGRLKSHPITAKRALVLGDKPHPALRPAGLSFVAVNHEGCSQSSAAEADAILALVVDLIRHRLLGADGKSRPLGYGDILVVAPYNMQVNLLKQRLPPEVMVGTVDKFQGQQAAVVIVSMTTSRGEDAPRGTDFLFNRNRFNVAVSRAQCLSIVVHGVNLLEGAWLKIDDLRRLNVFAHAEEVAQKISV